MDASNTPDDSELRGLDPFDALDREASRLDAHFQGLDDLQWQRPSRCEGWTTREMLSHLLSVEIYAQACLDDDLARVMKMALEAGATDVAGFNSMFIDNYADRPAIEVLDEWRSLDADCRSRMRERGRDGLLSTMVGPYPVGWQAFHFASELAIHADDIGVSIAPADEPERTKWRACYSRFELVESKRPVEVDVVDGRNVIRSGEANAELSDAELVEAVAGRLPAQHSLDPVIRDALRTAP